MSSWHLIYFAEQLLLYLFSIVINFNFYTSEHALVVHLIIMTFIRSSPVQAVSHMHPACLNVALLTIFTVCILTNYFKPKDCIASLAIKNEKIYEEETRKLKPTKQVKVTIDFEHIRGSTSEANAHHLVGNQSGRAWACESRRRTDRQ